MGFTKTQKPQYLENETLFFLQIKKFITYTSSATSWQSSFVVEVASKNLILKSNDNLTFFVKNIRKIILSRMMI